MAQRVVLLTGNHLCHNPRAFKSATTLARHGFEVEILGVWTDAALKTRDKHVLGSAPFAYRPVLDLTESKWESLQRRARRKIGQVVHTYLRVENGWQIGAAVGALDKAARERPAGLYIAHSEQGLAAAARLQRSGYRVGADMEDWFSEDLLPEARRHRPLAMLRSLERRILSLGAYSSCPSNAMSVAIAQEYQCRQPTVLYNAFPWSERATCDGHLKDRHDRRVPSIHWFSQTLGPGRGLEELAAALARVNHEAEVHLRGHPIPGFQRWLIDRIPERWRQRVFFHPVVSNDELLSRIAEHDIGFAGELTYCRSRDLTVTNKLLQYLLAGLAVVASATAGQREVAERAPDAVLLYALGNTNELAAHINALIESPQILQRAKDAASNAAHAHFNWEIQERSLLEEVEKALAREF